MSRRINLTLLDGINYLKTKDTVFKNIHDNIGNLPFEIRVFDLTAFCKIIIGQQLSSKAANTIFSRLKHVLKKDKIEPESITNLSPKTFREIGISNGKSQYLISFAKHIQKNPNFMKEIARTSSNQAYNSLIQLKGVGPWTANIIQLFYLGDLDIFPLGDTSLEKVYSNLYNTKLSIKNKKTYNQVTWAAPYKGILALYLWEYLDRGYLNTSTQVQ